jgi:hypothetical protein
VLTFVVAIIVPLTAFLLANRRMLHIMWAFARSEVISHSFVLVGGVMIILTLQASRLVAARFGLLILPVNRVLRQLPGSMRIVVAAAAVVLVVASYEYEALSYRVFSEVSYPQRALRDLRAGRLLDARETCEEYLRLYPQRRRGGSKPDRTCVPILSFTAGAAQLQSAIASTTPRPGAIDTMLLRVDWQARRESAQLLATFAAGEAADASSPNGQVFLSP